MRRAGEPAARFIWGDAEHAVERLPSPVVDLRWSVAPYEVVALDFHNVERGEW